MRKYYRLEYTLNGEEKSWIVPYGWSLPQALTKFMEVNKEANVVFKNVIVIDEKKRSKSSLYL